MKGLDAQKLAILDLLGEQYGFNLGLANGCCTLSGSADDDGRGWGRHGCGYGDSEEELDDDDVDFAEVDDR